MGRSFAKLYEVCLTPAQRESLTELTRNGHAPVKKVRHAQVLLWSDSNREDGRLSAREIGERLDMHVNTVDRIRKAFVLEGEGPALNRKPRAASPIPPKIDGKVEAHLIAICTGPPPEGRARWTLQLLAGELMKRGFVTNVSAETVRKSLKKIACSPGASRVGACPNGIRRASSRRWKAFSTSTRRSTAKMSL